MTCSVVIPCRDRHDRVARAVASAATIPFVSEVIVVDDGSSPPLTADLFHADRVRVVPNRLTPGAQGARVTGGLEARGDVILFLDSDDVLVADGVRRLHERLRSDDGTAMTYGNARRGGRVTDYLRLEGHAFRAVLKNLSLCPFSGLMVRKAAVPWGTLDLTLPAWQDDDFVLTVSKGGAVAFVDTVVATMELTGDAISRSRAKQLAGLTALVDKWRPDILRELGAPRLWLWRVRRLALWCLVIGDRFRARRSPLALVFYAAGRAFQLFVRPFFDRLYV